MLDQASATFRKEGNFYTILPASALPSGEIAYAGQPEGSALNRLRTSNGGVVVRVPRAAAIAFRASVGNGSISTELFLVGDTEGRDWNAVLNPPAATEMDLRTSNGTMRIEAAD